MKTGDLFDHLDWKVDLTTPCGGQNSSNTKDYQMNMRMVSGVLFTYPVRVIQKSYVLDDESEVENEEGEQDQVR